MPIQETPEYRELFQKWNKLANKITYLEPTPENFRELAKLSENLADMIGEEQKDAHEIIETQDYDFNMAWSTIEPKTKQKFIKKVKEIETTAIQWISTEEKVDVETIKEAITPLDPEAQWDSMLGVLPEDVDWIEFEIQFMREELKEKGVI